MDVWPPSLPQYVLVDGYSEEEADNLIEHKPDAGIPISRRRSSTAARPITFALELSLTQLTTLQDFYRETLLSGSLPFTFPTPNEATPQILKFQKGGQPKITGRGGAYRRISMALWVMP